MDYKPKHHIQFHNVMINPPPTIVDETLKKFKDWMLNYNLDAKKEDEKEDTRKKVKSSDFLHEL